MSGLTWRLSSGARCPWTETSGTGSPPNSPSSTLCWSQRLNTWRVQQVSPRQRLAGTPEDLLGWTGLLGYILPHPAGYSAWDPVPPLLLVTALGISQGHCWAASQALGGRPGFHGDPDLGPVREWNCPRDTPLLSLEVEFQALWPQSYCPLSPAAQLPWCPAWFHAAPTGPDGSASLVPQPWPRCPEESYTALWAQPESAQAVVAAGPVGEVVSSALLVLALRTDGHTIGSSGVGWGLEAAVLTRRFPTLTGNHSRLLTRGTQRVAKMEPGTETELRNRRPARGVASTEQGSLSPLASRERHSGTLVEVWGSQWNPAESQSWQRSQPPLWNKGPVSSKKDGPG
ncbi:uncharacterized protein LOC107155791 isoform X2 [Marmota marmota marmota]|uniref:uncharacterized protein LOC107155791 isoform X2 n=1 Tax=Marmota marmota marmota TaxID=9994 RepID=UPI00076251E2|nr:uncharacterized protein LOC107155791 isoform X2 [Marmota marmota marmota]